MIQKDLLNTITSVLEAEPQVRVAYVYGSQVNETMRKDSDVDVGVLLDKDSGMGKVKEISRKLDALLPMRIDCKRLELNQQPVYLKSVVCGGKAVVVRDDKERVNFEVRVMQRYRDDERRRRIYRQYYQEMFT